MTEEIATFVDAPLAHVQSIIDSSKTVDIDNIVNEMKRLTNEAIEEKLVQRLDHMIYEDATKRNGQLVHFRAMLQDELSPDYCTGLHLAVDNDKIEHKINGLYVDDIQVPEGTTLTTPDASYSSFRQRTVFTAVSVPGASPWTGAFSLPADSPIPKDAAGKSIAPCAHSLELRHALPLACRRHRHAVDDHVRACQVKIVGGDEADVRLNRVYDFYGILQMAEVKEENKENQGEKVSSETMEKMVVDEMGSPSHLPVIHVTTMTPVTTWHSSTPTTEPGMKEERDRCLALLENVFGGDKLAAELALYALIANVSHRDDMQTPVGKLVVNIAGVHDQTMAENVKSCVQQMFTHSHTLPITIESLKESRMAPRKDHTLNRLVTGRLQLADGTRLVVDETSMQEGKLDETGVLNVRTLNELLTRAAVAYDFQFHQQDFQNDWNILTLSTTKSMFPSDMHIICSPRRASTFNPSDIDDAMRRYVDDCRACRPDIEDETRVAMEQWYVTERQRDKSMSHEVLNKNIVMASLAAVTRGSEKVLMQDWNRALSLVILAESSIAQ